MTRLPAVCLIANPGRRHRILELAAEVERRGFPGIYFPGSGDISMAVSLAHVTNTIEFGTAIQPIYVRTAFDMASAVGYLHEVSNGRFRYGIGVSHEAMQTRMPMPVGKPLSDVREYVAGLRAAEKSAGELPPIVLATLRNRMVELAVGIADGAVWANSSRRAMPESLSHIPDDKRNGDFFIGCMIPTVIDDDREAAAAVVRKTMMLYVTTFPNYRNYWKAAGYVEEMEAAEAALAAGDRDRIPSLMSDRWLSDCTLYGSVGEVREGIEAWFDAGVKTPIIVPSSTSGGQAKAFEELFAAFDS
jgi:alkanesulfonate monooxygenase SsuD/methylene tetrahydromethanopterin reductase-like flavin-dependent oxidoreductase (luciferase family)